MPIKTIVPAGMTLAEETADHAGVVTDAPVAYLPRPATTHTAIADAGPVTSWEFMDLSARLHHTETCTGTCPVCENAREWGACAWCGADPVEALPGAGESRCCGSVVTLGRTA